MISSIAIVRSATTGDPSARPPLPPLAPLVTPTPPTVSMTPTLFFSISLRVNKLKNIFDWNIYLTISCLSEVLGNQWTHWELNRHPFSAHSVLSRDDWRAKSRTFAMICIPLSQFMRSFAQTFNRFQTICLSTKSRNLDFRSNFLRTLESCLISSNKYLPQISAKLKVGSHLKQIIKWHPIW